MMPSWWSRAAGWWGCSSASPAPAPGSMSLSSTARTRRRCWTRGLMAGPQPLPTAPGSFSTASGCGGRSPPRPSRSARSGWPMTGNRSSIVWTEGAELAPRLLELPEAEFAAELRARFGGFLGEVEPVGPRWAYPLSLMQAERYTARRLALVGEAAHVIHPIAGQGLNIGIRDIAAFAELIVDVRRLGLDIGDESVLQQYQRWRRADALLLAAVPDGR